MTGPPPREESSWGLDLRVPFTEYFGQEGWVRREAIVGRGPNGTLAKDQTCCQFLHGDSQHTGDGKVWKEQSGFGVLSRRWFLTVGALPSENFLREQLPSHRKFD